MCYFLLSGQYKMAVTVSYFRYVSKIDTGQIENVTPAASPGAYLNYPSLFNNHLNHGRTAIHALVDRSHF